MTDENRRRTRDARRDRRAEAADAVAEQHDDIRRMLDQQVDVAVFVEVAGLNAAWLIGERRARERGVKAPVPSPSATITVRAGASLTTRSTFPSWLTSTIATDLWP